MPDNITNQNNPKLEAYANMFTDPKIGPELRMYTQARPFTTEPNIRVRPGYDRSVYEAYRPNEAIPQGKNQEELHEIQIACTTAYSKVGVIRSVIDLMSEYACDGICIEHPDEGPNNFYQAWQKKINLEDRVERFLNWLYKSGTSVVRRKVGKIKLAGRQATVPLEYVFYDPSTVDLVGGYAAALAEKKTYGIRMPFTLWSDLRGLEPQYVAQIEATLPPEVLESMKNPSASSTYFVIEIPKDKLYIAHYKKDDSDIWAKSFIYSILSDIQYNDKVKLAKISAMDGIINVIRLWKIGAPEHNMFPSPQQFSKLATTLESNLGGGALDLIWGPDLSLEEFYPPIGDLVNFEENLDPILLGLGVPQSLVGGINDKTNVSVNFTGLKNLMKRLDAGRREVVKWLNAEIDIIQKEMGFSKRPYIRFNNSNLYDERVFLDLLIDLVDRDIISDSTVLERIKEIPEMEKLRIKKEYDGRNSGEIPDKASPFHQPLMKDQRAHELKVEKLKLTSRDQTNTKPSGNPGRPSGAKDKVKRKRGPKSFGDIATFASRLYDFIEDRTIEAVIKEYNVKDYRGLSSEAKQKVKDVIRAVMPLIEPLDNIDENLIDEYVSGGVGPQEAFAEYSSHTQTNLSKEDEKAIYIMAYTKAWHDMSV